MEQDLLQLLNSTAKELETILSTKTVVGAPIEVHGTTIIPLISIGFGLGVAAGSAAQAKQGEGSGSGLGFGGGIRPIAVIIANEHGARIETIKSGAASVVEKMADTISQVALKRNASSGE